MEIGPLSGDNPVSWQEIAAWEHLTGIELVPFEARAIRSMSRVFLSQRQDSRSPACPAPYSVETQKDRQDKVTQQFAAMMTGLAKRG